MFTCTKMFLLLRFENRPQITFITCNNNNTNLFQKSTGKQVDCQIYFHYQEQVNHCVY